jgi:hypothetical protein
VTREIAITVLVTLIVGDAARSSRWFAASLAHWAAERIYVADDERAGRRPEEWDALVRESVPSDISALCLGISLAVFAVACIAGRRVRTLTARARDAYARLTRVPAASLDPIGSRWEEHRNVSLALLESALELRLRLADSWSLNPEDAASQRPVIRRLTADVKVQAVNVSFLDPAILGELAVNLATVASRLTDRVFPPCGATAQATVTLDLTTLDESIDAFQHGVLVVSRDLADHKAITSAELVGPADDGYLASRQWGTGTEPVDGSA